MEKDVLHHQEVQSLLTSHFVAVHVDCSQPNELADQFQVGMLPTDIVIGPDEVVLLKSQGGRDRASYIKQLRQLLSSVPTPEEKPVEQQLVQKEPQGTSRVPDVAPGKAESGIQNSPKDQSNAPTPTTNDTKLLIGLDRYSPVSLARNREWRKGKTEFAMVFQGVVYLMADEEEYNEFGRNPSKYAPRLLGCDPVVLWSSDKAIPGSTQFGAYFDSELFLFSSAKNRDTFKGSPTRYSRPQHVVRVDEIDGPRWR